jgi:WD40 repeat protein
VFTRDATRLFAASGQPGLSGEVHQWSIPDGKLIQTLSGHKDAIYSMALSPGDKILATGSYDQKIKLWDVETGKELKTLSGHNGCVFGLAFRPDGKILASASADRTVKLWDVASGERRDTLSQPLKDVYAVAFSPDGKRLVAGGVDNRIRVWEISETAAETTNPILYSKFAHEGTILRLAFSPDGETLASSADDRTIKLWDAKEMHERRVLESQPDWAPGLVFVGTSKLAVGRLDGTLKLYDLAAASPVQTSAAK